MVASGVGGDVHVLTVCCCGDCEGGRDGIGEVVLFGVFAVEVCAFYVEEAAV